MEPTPTPEPRPDRKSYTWPIAVNLSILLLVAIVCQADLQAMGVAIAALMLLNGFTAIMLVFFGRLSWVSAFILSALLLPLIGFGLCALFIELNGGLRGGH